jgi:hypothetical protein
VLKNSVLKPTVIADSIRPSEQEIESMMGPLQVDQAPLSASSHLSDMFPPPTC